MNIKPSFTDSIFTSIISIAFSIGILGGLVTLALKFYLPITGQVTITSAVSGVESPLGDVLRGIKGE